jgi:hypothetical protein
MRRVVLSPSATRTLTRGLLESNKSIRLYEDDNRVDRVWHVKNAGGQSRIADQVSWHRLKFGLKPEAQAKENLRRGLRLRFRLARHGL